MCSEVTDPRRLLGTERGVRVADPTLLGAWRSPSHDPAVVSWRTAREKWGLRGDGLIVIAKVASGRGFPLVRGRSFVEEVRERAKGVCSRFQHFSATTLLIYGTSIPGAPSQRLENFSSQNISTKVYPPFVP